jgi:hypothetical protein
MTEPVAASGFGARRRSLVLETGLALNRLPCHLLRRCCFAINWESVLGSENASSNPTHAELAARANIGQKVIYFSLATVGILGLASIVAAVFVGYKDAGTADKSFALIRDTFTLLLPVLGTWVGTVLAFYFSRENFAEAAKQTANLVKQLSPEQKLEQIPVVEAMISLEDMTTAKYTLSKPENQVKLWEDIVEGVFKKYNKNRLPILDGSGRVMYVIHRSIIDKFIAEKAISGNTDAKALSLSDMIAADDYGQIAAAFGTVGKTTKLIEVKQQIDGNINCSDVFVTEDGTKKSKALGWITNVIVAEKAKL